MINTQSYYDAVACLLVPENAAKWANPAQLDDSEIESINSLCNTANHSLSTVVETFSALMREYGSNGNASILERSKVIDGAAEFMALTGGMQGAIERVRISLHNEVERRQNS